ncbi:hypothetical protein P152DRAFT_483503 [Eremomyces bilateralis CBS 781.70]|uniref:mRNA splicing factor RNA helicase n=1 Tax=Eremomyces bilateralis CBS 781.70 TaxID=1392243 RepID=A0A6G1FYM9_9PEZI|nr:uncharacterized protein P152DRAFT_483503 [Eremomyces bilateralis CBS 781.70]KAF1810776.1 hypothetical protein P152DRAFT_483503 [Eremomyces bilateralis CBS 781.70]
MDESIHEPLFRSAKRRKITRPRSSVAATSPPPQERDDAQEPQSEEGPSVAEILRLRKTKAKRFGVEFGAAKSHAAVQRPTEGEGRHAGTVSAVETAARRFAPQAGPVMELDRHMMAYVDSRIAEMHQGGGSTTESTNYGPLSTISADDASRAVTTDRERQPAGLGKLQEVDLGPSATQENIRRTQAATRRLEGVVSEEEEEGPVRKGRDGRPWRRRKRRNSDDVRRDKLVEQVLRESRLDLYDESAASSPREANDQAADDTIAEQFRRDFMEAQNKNMRRAAPPPPSQKVKPGEERPKGPKLGGSRSARAALRALEEKGKKK